MRPDVRCLLVFPEFRAPSFWNYRSTCDLAGAKYPAAPLGLVTVAALLPESWECRLVDCNVETLQDADVEWADLVFTGGMIAQQPATLELIDHLKARGKTVVVGGPDATSSPHLYQGADHLVLGEAEITLPRWLADRDAGNARKLYDPGKEMADVTKSPLPRFDLLTFDRYLNIGIQYARGCPFRCEFCDIIELFGRVPRLKAPDQILAELDRLHELGYRGHVDFVDDNFIGNQKELRNLLPKVTAWQEAHKWPFEFSTEASVNLADDDRLLELMQAAGFFAIFVGIESPDEETLKATQKLQNTRRSLSESLRKIYSYGIFVNTGYIVGFDTEKGSVAQGVIDLIEASAVPVNMVGLLFALPNTQLQRRLAKEGRLIDDFEIANVQQGDQCTAGLNFRTLRPRVDILRDYRRIIAESYRPEAYFNRVLKVGTWMNCKGKKLSLPFKRHLKDLRTLGRIIWRMGLRSDYKRTFWRTFRKLVWRNPRSLRYAIAMMALYVHFGPFKNYLVKHLDSAIASAPAHPAEAASAPAALATAEEAH